MSDLIEQKIISLYKDRKRIIDIAKELRKRQSYISGILKTNGVRIRTSKDSDFITSYNLDHSYFSIIDSTEKAYLLGVMFSDGSVSKLCNTISLVSKDLELIQFFKKKINCDKPVYIHPTTKAYSLSFRSPKMKFDLGKLGCVPRKSLILKYPNVSSKLEKHFILGLFDGDGCFTKTGKYPQIYWGGTLDICKKLQNYFIKLGVKTNKIQKDKSIYRLRITNQPSIRKIVEHLYENSSFYLKRKKAF